MITAAHTPLSWGYEYLPCAMTQGEDPSTEVELPNYRVFPWDDPEKYIAETNEHLPGELQEEHALLIAAAPDLFEALEYFFNIMHDYKCSIGKGYVTLAFQKARQALAKAKGGAI
jgi:hypothetical protein